MFIYVFGKTYWTAMTYQTTPRLFCFGLGYSASVLARALLSEGWRVAGTCRDNSTQKALSAQGVDAYIFDGQSPLQNFNDVLVGTTHLLSSVPPVNSKDPILQIHGAQIAAMTSLQWTGYLSTTGVYGNQSGGWVDETSPLEPTGERGQRRVDAELAWLALRRDHAIPVHLFRLAGIYGPGRNQIDAVRNGTAKRIDKLGQVFSRIHVDDIASVLKASMARPNPGAAYNVCDDEAAPPQDVISYIAAQLGIEPPPVTAFDDANLSPMAQSFYRDNKRVSNKRIKDELGVALEWPTYREGIKGLLECGASC
jgi:nucleoside-diphosphate-sugar epimerase